MIKDSEEINNLKKASKVTAFFFGKFIQETESIIDSGKPTKHSELARKIQEIMENEGELKKCAIKLASNHIVKDYIDLGPAFTVQSTGSFTPKLFMEANDK